jgi:holin-like protein
MFPSTSANGLYRPGLPARHGTAQSRLPNQEGSAAVIFDLTLLLLCQLAGEAVSFWTGLPVPGPVLGLALLVAVLAALGRPPGTLEATGNGLLQHLSLLFVPAGVGVMLHAQRIAAEWLPLLLALAFSTWLSIAVTALTMSWAARRFGAVEEHS